MKWWQTSTLCSSQQSPAWNGGRRAPSTVPSKHQHEVVTDEPLYSSQQSPAWGGDRRAPSTVPSKHQHEVVTDARSLYFCTVCVQNIALTVNCVYMVLLMENYYYICTFYYNFYPLVEFINVYISENDCDVFRSNINGINNTSPIQYISELLLIFTLFICNMQLISVILLLFWHWLFAEC